MENTAPNFPMENRMFDLTLHSQGVAELSLNIATEMKLNTRIQNAVYISSIYHDIGKNHIPHNILFKDSSLTHEEFEVMKTHAFHSYTFMNRFASLKEYAGFVLFHHENFDGSGYYSVKGYKIPFVSRIIHIADVFDALTSNRVYRFAMTTENAIQIMNKEAYKYDKNIYQVFLKIISQKLKTKV